MLAATRKLAQNSLELWQQPEHDSSIEDATQQRQAGKHEEGTGQRERDAVAALGQIIAINQISTGAS